MQLPADYLQIVVIVAVMILIFKFVKASAKLIITAAVIAVVVWLCINYLPQYI